MLQAMLAGIVERGRAEPGAKTMIDALAPAVEAYDRALAAGAGICPALQAAATAAEEGVRATVPMQATKGRASYLGERSIGHQDPGATSCALLLQALMAAACANRMPEPAWCAPEGWPAPRSAGTLLQPRQLLE